MLLFLEMLFTALSVFIATSIAELLTVPLVGTLVRFRANYAPKGLQLDGEGGAEAHAGPVVGSYFAMLRRVVRLEGARGLYKGFVPSILSTFLVTLFSWAYIGMSIVPRGHGRYSAPAASPAQLMVYTVFLTLVGMPLTILVNRAITTPYLLPWNAPRYAVRRLFTATERRRPWMLYVTPGLLAAKVLQLFYVILVMKTCRSLLLPSVDVIGAGAVPRGAGVPPDFTLLRVGTYLLLAALSTGVLCPLEVLATRLSLQRTHEGEYAGVPQDEGGEGEGEDEGEYAGTEDVIGLRSEFDPYVGFTDAVRRMVEEEGWRSLYRGWWVTLLASVMSALV